MAKILIVEDGETNIRAYTRYLSKHGGHELLTADNTQDAIAVLNEHPDIDFAIIDKNLLDGISLPVIMHIREKIWSSQGERKRPLFVTATDSSHAYEVEGAVACFKKGDLFDNLIDSRRNGVDNCIEVILKEHGIVPVCPTAAAKAESAKIGLGEGG